MTKSTLQIGITTSLKKLAPNVWGEALALRLHIWEVPGSILKPRKATGQPD
jgi:hypothetical protein